MLQCHAVTIYRNPEVHLLSVPFTKLVIPFLGCADVSLSFNHWCLFNAALTLKYTVLCVHLPSQCYKYAYLVGSTQLCAQSVARLGDLLIHLAAASSVEGMIYELWLVVPD